MAKKLSEEDIYEKLKSAILNRNIPLSMQLNEIQLAEAFEVSRTPIRSALKRLQYEKLVKIYPNKGAFVYQPTQREIQDVFDLRLLIEGDAVKKAVQIATNEDLNELEVLTHKEEQLYQKDDYGNALQMTSNFHLGIVKLCNNELMLNYCQELINITNVYLAFHDSHNPESPRCPSEHRKMIEAIRARDEKLAIQCFEEHFHSIRDHIHAVNDQMDANRPISLKQMLLLNEQES